MKEYISLLMQTIRCQLTRKYIPILVTLCVTNRCNLKCIYCYAEYYDRNSKEYTTEELLNLIVELAEMGTKRIALNGGEALLRDDFGILVDKVKEKNMLCHLSTNGLLVKDNIPALKKLIFCV